MLHSQLIISNTQNSYCLLSLKDFNLNIKGFKFALTLVLLTIYISADVNGEKYLINCLLMGPFVPVMRARVLTVFEK